MSVKHTAELESTIVEGGTGVTKKVLISSEEGPNFAMRRFEIQPGGGMPNHINLVEHEQYVLSGQARIAIGEEIYHVKPGDVVFIPNGSSSRWSTPSWVKVMYVTFPAEWAG